MLRFEPQGLLKESPSTSTCCGTVVMILQVRASDLFVLRTGHYYHFLYGPLHENHFGQPSELGYIHSLISGSRKG